MRIHQYMREFPAAGDPGRSGMVKAVHGLAAGFAANGARITMLCQGPQTAHVQHPCGYDIRCFSNDPARDATLPPGLVNYIQRCDEPGVFLLNGVFTPNVYAMSRLCMRCGIPYVVAPHDPYHPSIFATNRRLKWPYWYLREKPMLQRASAIQVLDFRHAEWLRAWGVHTPVFEVLNGYAPEDVLPESALAWRTEGAPRLLYLGRIDYHNKGLDILLDAVAQIASQTGAQLTLQGPDFGDRHAMQRRAQRRGIADRVQFLDPDFDTPAAQITAEHDVFMLPSRFEGFGLSALEAMLSARVLLVADVAGIAPHIRASGCGIVVSSDVEHVKDGLLQLLSMRSKWREMGLAGRAYALERLRWKRIAADTIEQYRTLLRPAPARKTALAKAPAAA